MPSDLDLTFDVVFTDASKLEQLVASLSRTSDEEIDYQLEAHLEALTASLSERTAATMTALAKRKKSMADLGTALRTVWLEGDVPRCGAELKVRAAEALGAWSAASKEPKADIVKRLKSKRFEHRMWAARAVRAADWGDADKLLAPLASDPYEDDNGFFLVREAAGFHD